MLLYLLLALIVVACVIARRRHIATRARVACEVAAEQAAVDTALAVRRPIVLAHGILGFGRIHVWPWRLHYFRGVVTHLRRAGLRVYTPRLPPLGSVPARAAALAEFVRSLPHDQVTIIAHSMGGLDARYAISRLGLAPHVAELITVATPHHGTPLADLAARPSMRLARRVLARVGLRTDALDWLTTERLARFNAEVPNAAGPVYYCVIARAGLRAMWRHPLLVCHLLMRRRWGDNDGIVPVSSQRWGEALIETEAHHWGQIGWSLRCRAPALYETVLRRLPSET